MVANDVTGASEGRDLVDRAISEPAPVKSLLGLLAELRPIDDDFEPVDDPSPDSVEL